MDCKETLELLPAYADHELGLPEAIEIDKHVQDCPACRDEITGQKALRAALRRHATYFIAPSHLEHRLKAVLALKTERKSSPARRAWHWFGQSNWLNPAAALASVIAVAWSASLYLALPSAGDVLAEEVVAGHVRSLMANHIADVISTDQHTVKPWFNGKLDFSPTVTDFAAQGFPLVGGRLDYLDHRPVAALVYRHAQHPINIYIWPATAGQEAPPRTLTRQGYHLAHWIEGGMVYWAVSDVDPHELQHLVAILQTESRPHSGSPSDPKPAS
jgi:anti-sigma factor RsiW